MNIGFKMLVSNASIEVMRFDWSYEISYLIGEHFPMISEDGDDQLDGLHSNLELFVEGHGNDAVLKKTSMMMLKQE